MAATDILQHFKACFPAWANDVVMYKPVNDDSHKLKIELKGKRFFIFTYISDKEVRLETVRMYENDRK